MLAQPPTKNFHDIFDSVFSKEERFFFYLIGPPAAGKTTVLDRALEMCRLELRSPPERFGHRLIKRSASKPIGFYLGKRREGFGGTDALAMNAITGVIDQMVKERPPIVVGEGDRLANDRFFQTMRSLGYQVYLYHLGANEAILQKRDAARGSSQDPAWRKGRTTKANKLAVGWKAMKLNATMPVDKNAGIISQAINDRISIVEEQVG